MNNSIPKVSVVMNCYNSAKYLREAIDSVYAQTFTDWEIVFWDNASTDKSAEIAKSYDNKIKYFCGDKTVPLGAARNLALKECRGKYIAFLDCDDIWLPKKLEKQMVLFERKPELGLIFSDSYFFNDAGIIKQLYKNYKPPRGLVFRELLSSYFLDIETVVIRTDILKELPEWFDERLHVCEETDLFLRIAYSYPVDYVDEVLSKWRVHQESDTFKRHELFAEEGELIIEKLSKQFDGLVDEYPNEIAIFKKKIAIEKALTAAKSYNTKKCRNVLRPFVLKDPKVFALFLLTFFGARLLHHLVNKRSGF
jgi:glycosyltransferase involved in cell wall biosynthesis